MTKKILRAGIVGAGFISDYHLKAIDQQDQVTLAGVCDLNEQSAKKLASGNSDTKVYTDLAAMLEAENLDVLHVLTQPDSHLALATMAIDSGCHVILEKPATITSADAITLKNLALNAGVGIGINHNFVFSRPFNKLREVLEKGELGPIKSVRVVWKKSLAQITSGPWNLWMLREPGNILFETGAHSISELLAIVSDPHSFRVDARLPKILPSGSVFYKRWNIFALEGKTSIQIDTSFDHGYEQHFVEVEGLFGIAKADIENDVFTIEQPTGRAYDLERLCVNFSAGKTRVLQSIKTYLHYAASKFLPNIDGAPYDTSMVRGIVNCYAEIMGQALRRESSIDYAIEIAKVAEAIRTQMPHDSPENIPNASPKIPPVAKIPEADAKILIVGASGFIGKKLLMALQDQGKPVRALVRNASSLIGVELNNHSEIVLGDFRDKNLVSTALNGIEVVFHLAVAHSNSLKGYLNADSEPTIEFAKLCQERGVKRFIYSGTIDSLYLGPNAGKVTELDGVDSQIKRRNNYAHSKAITENKLRSLHQQEGLPLVIVRPAIVLGPGGPVDHVGVANWHGLGRCTFWGNGHNLIPAVLVDDIVKGMIAASTAEDIEGNTYNLSAEPCISARDYVAEVEKVIGAKIVTSNSSFLSLFAGDFAKWIIKILARHPDRQRIPSLRDWRCRGQYASFDTTRAEDDLGWKPTNDRDEILEKGVSEPSRLFLDS